MANLNHLSSLILNTPLLCTPEYAETLCAVLGDRISVDNLGMVAQDKDASKRSSLGLSDHTKVIPIIGSMTHRSTGIEAMSGMTSYASLQDQVEEAMSDKEVKNILLDIDSGGGQVAGAFDFRDYLLEQRGRKPMIAVARDTMASAAYLIGSATDKIYVTQTGAVGSIGVVAMHVDKSEANAKAGVKPTFIYAGDYKTAGSPHAPLEGEALSYLQESVNDSYEMFISAVSEARGMEPDAVRATQARMYRGQKAVQQGLADGVSNFDTALSELALSAPRVYQSMSTNTNKETLMEPEEIETLKADAAKAQSDNETLRGLIIAEGYSITADGLVKDVVEEADLIEVAGTMVDKASLPEAVVTALTEAAEAKMDAQLTESAAKDLPHFDMKDAKALILASNGDEGIMKALKSADAALGSLMEETGATDVKGDMLSAKDKFEALVNETMETEGMTYESAKTEATSSAKGRELIKQVRKENT